MNTEPSSPSAVDDPVDKLLAEARAIDPEMSEFDYIIVGSGAGGGPLAARLAEAGKKVLVIEAGSDPTKTSSKGYPNAEVGEVTKVPGYYAAASEDAEMSWMYSVRHHADDATQAKDEKFNKNSNPNTGGQIPPKFRDPHPGGGKQGIFYPRSSGVGGCTAHHAMITIRPNDKDWNYIANLTGDDSWRSGAMRGYFAKFENNQYIDAYDRFLNKLLGPIYKLWRRVVLLFDPRAVLDDGGHGFKGWAPTNLIDPFLVSTIAKEDRPLFKVIVRAALGVLHGKWSPIAWLKRQILRTQIVPAIDFNDVNTRRANPEGVFLIPIGTQGKPEPDAEGQQGTGRRFGVREFLLTARRNHPDKLVIKTGAHVTRVLFEKQDEHDVPRAIGVECALGEHLYEASPEQKSAADERVRYFAKKQGGEIILCGGAFNTPQLLMLSGIGEKEHLASRGIHYLSGADGNPLPAAPVIDLPGVGRNLQDRYEVTVVSELDNELKTLDGVSFEPGDKDDPARQQWLKEKSGLYSTNGGTLAVIRVSEPAKAAGEKVPDLFTFGAPAAFRGYYWNWSRELFKATLGAPKEERKIWSWVILKAYTNNTNGSVRLRTASPFEAPEICFDSFNEKAEVEAEQIRKECEPYLKAGEPLPEEMARRKEANDCIVAESRRDLAALVDAVRFMRKVNAQNPGQFVREIQPGPNIPDSSPEMEEWIRTQAWGHHCSCTCRIGSDAWKPNTGELTDREAVLDSRFKVHGVKGLRIVDASVFPKIPGYFILAPIFMISEKAADTLIEDSLSAVYPAKFEADEAAAIRERRSKALIGESREQERYAKELEQKRRECEKLLQKREQKRETPAGKQAQRPIDKCKIPRDSVGLALSGGGIRSSTFALGVIQALAERNRLREVDILSTVSGGGFIGSFLGRLFTRESVKLAKNPCERVQETVKNSSSAPIEWLRTQANYIFATGTSDLQMNLSAIWRNLFTVYLVVGALLFTIFGLLAWLPAGVGILLNHLGVFQIRTLIEPHLAPPLVSGIMLSPWWWLPVLALGLGVLPATLGYWLAPRVGSYRPYPFFSLLAWLVLLTGSLIAINIPHGMLYAGGVVLVLVLAWAWQEVARWGAIHGPETEAERRKVGGVVRNRVVRSLGEVMFIFAGLAAWVVLDTFAVLFAQKGSVAGLATATAALAPLMPILQKIAMGVKKELAPGGKEGFSLQRIGTLLGIPLAIFLLFAIDVLAHKLFVAYPGWGWGIFVIGVTAAFSLAIGRAFDFLNLSSLQATYAARLIRTFQGASNEERVYASTSSEGHDVGVARPDDDIPWHEYHPERQGGPLHLINVTVNETVDAASERNIRERKGLPMCVTPHGVSVGRRYFARWSKPDSRPLWQKIRRWLAGVDGDDEEPLLPLWGRKPDKKAVTPALTALNALPFPNDPYAFHVLATKKSESAEVESLTLGEWTGISGAAFSTGIGRRTQLSLSLFMGLTNVRLGHWWDTGIRHEERLGRYPESLWRRLKRLPVTFFHAQSMLLAEWLARFHGPSRWFWYLSDGGHFEDTGLYEMVRRRLRFMIVSDAGDDPDYQWNDVSLLTQQVREDFGAEIVWVNWKSASDWVDAEGKKRLDALRENEREKEKKEEAAKTEKTRRTERWQRILGALPADDVRPDEWIQDWIDPDTLGTLNDIKREGKYHAALARVTYAGSPDLSCPDVSWILLLKPGLNTELTQDILNYGKVNEDFPQTPTFDQVFDDIQWESYRALGQQIAGKVLR